MKPWLDDTLVANGKTIMENFSSWFGDSKITSSSGEPLTVYHGTRKNFHVFDKERWGQTVPDSNDIGFFFSSSASEAAMYAGTKADRSKPASGGNVIPVFLRIESPHVVDVGNFEPALWYDYHGQTACLEAQKKKCDGLIVKSSDIWSGDMDPHWLFVAFEANQIKSAIGNSGLYSDTPSLTDKDNVLLRKAAKAKTAIEEMTQSFAHKVTL